MGRLFGTDGIRGAANSYPLTVEMLINIGRALAHLYRKPGQHVPQIIIGKDTRLSGDMLESALAAGICSAGGNALMAGVLPTPGVAFLIGSLPTDAGVVISASHNPFEDNVTQNLCRVMVEGPKADLTESYCRQIAAVVQEKLV
jgi:phosphoglucosamine mutase